jgi:DNA-binding response OmpR family regulator
MAHILLVEDDKSIRMALDFALTRAGYEVSCAANGSEGLEAARTVKPDLILLDILLPKLSGIEVARNLRSSGSKTPIIMLTALDGDGDKIAGLDAGADDYVTKPFSTPELLARIRANLRRQGLGNAPSGTIVAGPLTIDIDATRVTLDGKPVKLRTKEYALLLALATHQGALCTRQWLAQEVWGEVFLPTSRTIDTHVRRLRKALDGTSWTFVQTEHGMGYRFDPIQEGA